jgi:hypothetical protein
MPKITNATNYTKKKERKNEKKKVSAQKCEQRVPRTAAQENAENYKRHQHLPTTSKP